MSHLTNIHKLHDVLLENNISLDNAAYRVTKAEGSELAREISNLHPSLVMAVAQSRSTLLQLLDPHPPHNGWQLVHGGMYDGVRIIVLDS